MAKLDPVSILGPGGAIARRLPQLRASRRSSSRWPGRSPARSSGPGHLVVEAGTGVGKSFAYLVPAIQATADPKKKVVVSTHTIALQEQLLHKDIPFLRSVMPQEFSAVLVKGRSNYISLRRLDVAIQRQNAAVPAARGDRPARHDPDVVEPDRATAAAPTWTSARCPASGRPCRARTATAWAASARDTASASSSRPGGGCRTANVLVVNHALFVTDLALRGDGLRARCPTTRSP